MTKKYAIFFLLPFESKPLCIYEMNSCIKVEVGHELQPHDELICINYDDYLHSIQNSDCIPAKLFDINVAVRILCGFPAAKFQDDNAPWKGISCLGKHLSTNVNFPTIKAIEKSKFGNYTDWIRTLPNGWEKLLIDALKCEHSRLVKELEREGVLDQYIDVDMTLKCVFAKIGIQGIAIDHDRLYSKYCALDLDYYRAVKTLEIKYKFMVDSRRRNLTFGDIKDFLKEYNPEDFSKKYFWESIELMQESSEFLSSLLTEHRNRWDLAELLRISSSISQNCKIEYDIFGTVSGRILLTRPGIQYLKRTSRDIFSPNDGFTFIYADYVQFEPGILASFSCDTTLIDLYNSASSSG